MEDDGPLELLRRRLRGVSFGEGDGFGRRVGQRMRLEETRGRRTRSRGGTGRSIVYVYVVADVHIRGSFVLVISVVVVLAVVAKPGFCSSGREMVVYPQPGSLFRRIQLSFQEFLGILCLFQRGRPRFSLLLFRSPITFGSRRVPFDMRSLIYQKSSIDMMLVAGWVLYMASLLLNYVYYKMVD